MKRIVGTTMLWDFSGTETLVTLQESEAMFLQTYITRVTVTLLGRVGTMRIEFYHPDNIYRMHGLLEKRLQQIIDNSLFRARKEAEEYHNLHVSHLEFRQERGRRFTHTAVEQLLVLLKELGAENRGNKRWPIPQVTIETFTEEDNHLISEGEWLANQFYPTRQFRQ